LQSNCVVDQHDRKKLYGSIFVTGGWTAINSGGRLHWDLSLQIFSVQKCGSLLNSMVTFIVEDAGKMLRAMHFYGNVA